MVITGGEPMLDRKSMPQLLDALLALPHTQEIRIDTNASWNLKFYDHLDRSKLMLMCTFHPSHTTEERFFRQIDAFQDAGFQIGMVNYVMAPDNIAAFKRRHATMAKRGIPLHPNPLWNAAGRYDAASKALLRDYLPPLDYRYRTGDATPRGKKCFFPRVAYEMDQAGRLYVGCHSSERGSLFDETLPTLFAGPVPCPANTCNCLDKYSFLEGETRNQEREPFAAYTQLLHQHQPAALPAAAASRAEAEAHKA